MAFDARQRSTMLLQNCSICTIGFKNNTKKKSQSSGLRINRLSSLLVFEENWLSASSYKTFRSFCLNVIRGFILSLFSPYFSF